MSKAAFYDRMDELINPTPLTPELALGATLDALTEQIRRRVLSVAAGEQWKDEHPGEEIPMPEGPAIFQTAGPWEDFSTPSRDLRLLIAIHTAIAFPERISSHPRRFRLSAEATPESESLRMTRLLREQAASRSFGYQRSDGSEQPLSVGELIDRCKALEMAYNPNDCPERRWGAPPGSEEMSTCRARAPQEQLERMMTYRVWFEKRQRPVQ